MATKNESISFDEELIDAFKTKVKELGVGSRSAIIGELVARWMKEQDDAYSLLEKAAQHDKEGDEIRDRAYQGILKIIEEGNKQEREIAEQHQKQQDIYQQEKNQKLVGCMAILRKWDLWEQLIKPNITDEELSEIELRTIKIANEKNLEVQDNAVAKHRLRLILKHMDELLQLEYQNSKKHKKEAKKDAKLV